MRQLNLNSAAFFAAGHDGGVQSVAQTLGHFVDLMAPIDLYRFAGRVEDDFAVTAFLQVLLDFSASLGGNRIVDQIVEYGEKLGTGHDAASTFDGIEMGKKWFMAVVWPGFISLASFPGTVR